MSPPKFEPNSTEITQLAINNLRTRPTGIRGIFTAGNATDGHDKQIVIAAGEGAVAALVAFEYLVKQV